MQLTVDISSRKEAYPIRFDSLDNLPPALADAGLRSGKIVVVTDANVEALYAGRLVDLLREDGWAPRLITVPSGEATKSFEQLHRLYDDILSWGIDRKTPIVAFGGGVVGDLAGYAAATSLRGLPLVQVPTTVIAQVDSSIGGKTGINHAAGKNLIGAFHQPRLVFADPSLLASLPPREWFSGLAEVVKHALIDDAEFARWLEENWMKIEERDEAVVRELVPRAAAIKAAIVEEDVLEHGRRSLLNFGHTFGHAIERIAGYGGFTHGEAVALGMRAAIHVSSRLYPDADFSSAAALARKLPVEPDPSLLNVDDLMDAMQFDKKVEAGELRLVILADLGRGEVDTCRNAEVVEEAWRLVLKGEI